MKGDDAAKTHYVKVCESKPQNQVFSCYGVKGKTQTLPAVQIITTRKKGSVRLIFTPSLSSVFLSNLNAVSSSAVAIVFITEQIQGSRT